MKKQRILLLGNGGRENAIAWKVNQSELLEELFIGSWNAGTGAYGRRVKIDMNDKNAIVSFLTDHHITMLIIGPETPLVNGLVDRIKREPKLQDLMIIGPSEEGAQLEGSKKYAKEFMEEFSIPTASYQVFKKDTIQEGKEFIRTMTPPIVLKANGLAGGKGVLIIDNKEQACQELEVMLEGKFGVASDIVVIEQFLRGIEFSIFILTDGKDYVLLPEAKDYKQIGEGDTGLNTGGMGSVSPVPFFNKKLKDKVEKLIIRPTIKGIQKRGIDYKGFIFFGLININGNPYVIEYNVRLGDPETQSILPRLESDLVSHCIACCQGTLSEEKVIINPNYAVATVLVSSGYPEEYDKGHLIQLAPLDQNEYIFHAGTTEKNDLIFTNGGRVLACVALNKSLADAQRKSQQLATETQFANKYFRKDIGNDLRTIE